MDSAEAEALLRRVSYWQYPFEFPWGRVSANKPGHNERHQLRRKHFFEPLLALYGGSLNGVDVLDLGCCQGYWSFESSKAGARSVLGLDSSEEFIEQAKAIKLITGDRACGFEISQIEEEPWWNKVGSIPKVTLFLGLLYHLADPTFSLRRAMRVTSETLIVDTEVARAHEPCLFLRYRNPQEPTTVGSKPTSGLRTVASVAAVKALLDDGGFKHVQVLEPVAPMPSDYLDGTRVTFIARR